MTNTEESPSAPPVAAGTGESGKKTRKPLGAWRIIVLVWASAAICAFAILKTGMLSAEAEAESTLINVNTATVAVLRELPNVNQKVAEAIVSERPFKSIDDLLKVKGIGEKKLEKLRPFITVE